jgi:hypothetical protein
MADRRQVMKGAVVAVAGVVLLPACGADDAVPAPAPTPDAQQADELQLVAAYDAALAQADPSDLPDLQRIRDEHASHLAALGWTQPAPSSTPSGPPTRAQLARAERRAARLRTQAARETQDAEQAQILALIAASEAQHAVRWESP